MDVDFHAVLTHGGSLLEQIISWRGRPLAIRCDNGPEYLSDAITQWAGRHGIALNYIQPGKPQQNAYVERLACHVTSHIVVCKSGGSPGASHAWFRTRDFR
ncbi:hypothetical protein JCM10599A_66900 [Paraburkholderia kururiensis]